MKKGIVTTGEKVLERDELPTGEVIEI